MKVVKYTLGVFFILGGIGSISQGIMIAGLLMCVLGALFLPPVSEQLKEKFKIWRSKGIRYVFYIVILGIIGAFLPIDELDAQALKEKSFMVSQKDENPKEDAQSNKKSNFKTCNFVGGDFYIIPDLIAVDIYTNLQEKGFSVNKNIKNEGIDIHCSLSYGGLKYDVIVTGCTPSDIISVETTAMDASGNNSEAIKSFLGYMATLQYKNSKPQEAREWVENNLNKDGAETTIEGITFSIHKSKYSKFMRMQIKEDQEEIIDDNQLEEPSKEKKIRFDGNGNIK
ncbi:hypothetical protein ACFO4P_12945 [Epilithonimonas pallida]|uniref:Uncharacterized protein n=1 Tax=Epilithonimonas pallida TaxID=373671 RepID=A0ABY1R4P6_9FLAO|nr:hypothetical protein [Epilithonimonas pallida]SMP95465.1 hypothetical protein SAMN05421679_107135 [Epilithonimonas pallida]